MPTVEERLWAKVDKNGPVMPGMESPCWVWTGSKTRPVGGYGRIFVDGRAELVHRVAWWLRFGRWPEPMALHRCDNRICARVDHLVEGTHQDNMRDMVIKGRRHAAACLRKDVKLSNEKAREIRALYQAGFGSHADLARRFGVPRATIGGVLAGRTWKQA